MLTSTLPQRKVFNTIQILRGVAALIVVLFHLTIGYEKRGQQMIFDGFFRNGFSGVDLFFVISGFVIMHTSHWYFSTPDYLGTYIRKRLIRIYPVYWATLLFIIGGLLIIEFVTKKSADYLPATWSLMVSSLLLLPNHPNINGVTWSLSFELYYYLLFGLLIISRQFWPVIAIVLAISLGGIFNPTLFTDRSSPFFYFFSPYNLEFASGVAAWWIVNRFKISSLVCFLLLGVASIWLLIQHNPSSEEPAKRVIYYGFSSFLLVLSFTGLENNRWFQPSFINRLLMNIGNASYLIYIIHFPLLPFYNKLLVPVMGNIIGQDIGALLFTVVLTFACIDLHNRFEAPLVKKLNLFFKSLTPNNG